MKQLKILIYLAGFLIMVASAYLLFTNIRNPQFDKYGVYINVAALFVLMLAAGIVNKNERKNNK